MSIGDDGGPAEITYEIEAVDGIDVEDNLDEINFDFAFFATTDLEGNKRIGEEPLEIDQDVYIQLPEEAGRTKGICGKLNFWLCGMRPAAAAWEKHHADKLEGSLLLVHGSGDDNVHYQNSMEMINALVAANKDFDFFVYPDRNHGIYGGNTRLHLFNMMMDFVKENF